jgi:prepilin-type N-terminal cleavage/methylation domain-containing protein
MNFTRSRSRPGFTLIELLLVVAIIGVLVSLTLAAGTKVVSVGRTRATQWSLQVLDDSIGEYIQSNGAIPAPSVKDPVNANARVAIVDGQVGAVATSLKPMDSTAWYLYQLQSEGSPALATVNQVDARFRKVSLTTGAPVSDVAVTGARTMHILDVWGNPIRYVHPRFGGTHGVGGGAEDVMNILGQPWPQGATYTWEYFSRDPTPAVPPAGAILSNYKNDADGGAPANRRPYFYSAGPDGDPSTTSDNVYSTLPNLPR